MSTAFPPQHKSLRDEILWVIGRASAPLDSGQIYERCTLADEIKRVSDALWFLRDSKKIKALDGEGRKRYVLADGKHAEVAKTVSKESPAPAENAPIAGFKPAGVPAAPAITIPVLGEAKPPRGPYRKRQAKAAPAADQVIKPVADQAPDQVIKPGPDTVGFGYSSGKIADAMIADLRARLRKQMPVADSPSDAAAPVIHIHIEQVDIHLGGL